MMNCVSKTRNFVIEMMDFAVYEHRKFNNDSQYSGALRMKWKILLSREHAAGWFGQFSPNASY